KRNVAGNAQSPRLIGGGGRIGTPYNMNRICPAGAVQFTSGDDKCDVCHQLSGVLQNLSNATHHYTNIAAGPYDTWNAGQSPNPAAVQSVEPFPDPQPPGYTVAPSTAAARAPPIVWGAN